MNVIAPKPYPNHSVARGIHAMPARTEKNRRTGVKNPETARLVLIATPSGMLVSIASDPPTNTRRTLCQTWLPSTPESTCWTKAPATSAGDGKTRTGTSNSHTAPAHASTSVTKGATNQAAAPRAPPTRWAVRPGRDSASASITASPTAPRLSRRREGEPWPGHRVPRDRRQIREQVGVLPDHVVHGTRHEDLIHVEDPG